MLPTLKNYATEIKFENVSVNLNGNVILDDISVNIPKGSCTAIIGPNGAGKSTSMRMIGGFIPPSSGEISVCGINVLEDSLASRAKIGYLPESNPLYFDMYVKEYLHFVASIHKIKNKKLATQIDQILDNRNIEMIF